MNKIQADFTGFTDALQLGAALEIRGGSLTYLAHNMDKVVKKFMVTTNKGKKERTIFAPSRGLKLIQQRMRERMLLKLEMPAHVHGFVVGRSTRSNASGHGGGLVVNIDLKDFFPTITPQRVYGIWHKIVGLPPRAAWIATRLTTFENHLCQGFPTSPDIANIAALGLDHRLVCLSAKFGFHYTRYADDLTFTAEKWGADCSWLVNAVKDIARDEGFTVHPDKVAIMRPGRRQVVTGLVVNRNEKDEATHVPRIPRRQYDKLRAMADKGPDLAPEDRMTLTGWISYVHSVQPEKADKLKALYESRIATPKTNWSKNNE